MYNGQLCKIKEACERSFFPGQPAKLYYTLSPIDREEDFHYVPAAQAKEKCRPVLSKAEIELMRHEIDGQSIEWIEDRAQRAKAYGQILKEGDPARILMLIRSLLEKKTQLTASKKKLTSTDEELLSTAEKMIDEEFAYVLQMNREELTDFFQANTNA
jgi:CarD family transcriptional regulator